MKRILVLIGLLVPLTGSSHTLAAQGEGNPWAGTPQERFYNSRIMKKYQCDTCHTVMDNGGTVGPILNRVGDRREEEWIRRWVRDPQQIKLGTKMPKFNFTKQEYDEVIQYLTHLKKPLKTEEILSSAHTLVQKGEALFRDFDCYACHRIGDAGRFIGPDLTWVGLRKNQDWEKVWLHDPSAWKPGTFMPNFHISDKAIDALTAYLHSLQGQANKQSQEWEFNVNFYLNNKADHRGELVWKRFACWACHGEEGIGGIRNPNAAPNEEMPSIRDAANKYSVEELEGKLSTLGVQPKLKPDLPPPPFSCPNYGKVFTASELSDLYAYLKSLAPRKRIYRFK